MVTANKTTPNLKVRFMVRMLGALLAAGASLLWLLKDPVVSPGPDYLAFVAGAAAALLLAHAFKLFGPVGGRFLIVAALATVLCASFYPADPALFRSPKDLKIFLYLVSAIADACGLLLVYRVNPLGEAPAGAPVIEPLLPGQRPSESIRNN